MAKELEDFKEEPKAEIHINSLKTTLTQKNQIGKHQVIMKYKDSGLKNFPTIHDRQALEMNRCLQEANVSL